MRKILVTENQLLRLVKNINESKRAKNYNIRIEMVNPKHTFVKVHLFDENDWQKDEFYTVKFDTETFQILKAKRRQPLPAGFLNDEQIWRTFLSNEELMKDIEEAITDVAHFDADEEDADNPNNKMTGFNPEYGEDSLSDDDYLQKLKNDDAVEDDDDFYPDDDED